MAVRSFHVRLFSVETLWWNESTFYYHCQSFMYLLYLFTFIYKILTINGTVIDDREVWNLFITYDILYDNVHIMCLLIHFTR